MLSLTETQSNLDAEIRLIREISVVPSMLEMICRTTGMGFAAIARVTEDRWIACSVRDEINFGLKPGGELQIETTICNEIRSSRQPVIIDHVDSDDTYCNHHTPRMYGFQSYISLPIILKNGEFFGTLCAIDPKPANVSDPKIVAMFSLFAELIAFHLKSMDVMERSRETLKNTSLRLTTAEEENKQYSHLTHHSLMEPLRKIMLFCDILVQETLDADIEKARQTAEKIHTFSLQLAEVIRPLRT